MGSLKQFLKTSGIYLIGNVLIKAVAFFMLPIYTKFLSPTDYGTYDVNIAYITFLSSALFLDIWSGVLRYMFDFERNKDKQKPVLSGLVIFSGSTVVYLVFTFALGKMMSVDYIFWVFLYGLTMNLQQLMAYIARGYAKNALFAVGGFIGAMCTMLLNVIFIAFMHLGYQYLYIASIVGALINTIMLANGVSLRQIISRSNFNYQLTKEIFIFSLPLTVNSISWWFLTAFNRVILTERLSPAANGLYAVANKFSSIVQLFDQAFQMAWQEISFAKGGSNDENKGQFFTNAINEYIKFMSLGIGLLLPSVKILFPYFVNASYNDAFQVIPLALIATLFSSISTFLGGTLTAIKKNRYLFTTTLSGTIVNIIVILVTINFLYIQAASLALALGYVVVDIRRMFLLRKYISFTVNLKVIFSLLGLLLVASLVFVYLNVLCNLVLFISIVSLMLFIYRNQIRNFLKKSI